VQPAGQQAPALTIDGAAAPTPAERLAVGHAWRGTLRRLLRHGGARFGLAVVAVVVLMALGADVLSPYDPIAQNSAVGLSPPSLTHPMGTDEFGRDIFSRVIHGARLSLLVAVGAVVISATLGTLLGLLAGYLQGGPDMVIMRPMDVLLAFPGLLLALALSAILGTGLNSVILAVGIAGIPNFARIVRGAVMNVRENEYVLAARTIGAPGGRIVGRHLLPNVAAPIIVMTTLYVAFAVLTASSLSFLGVGVQPPTPEWGAMTNAGRHILRVAWWVSTFPGLMIMLLVLAVNLIGDGLRDALDPNLRV
jgi:peptide/nickel transport system permease protein